MHSPAVGIDYAVCGVLGFHRDVQVAVGGDGGGAFALPVDGQGVALGNTSLVADDLAAGRLVKPFDLALRVAPEFGYYLVAPKHKVERPLVKAFREWLLEEIALGRDAP